jgi:hypothetical protein
VLGAGTRAIVGMEGSKELVQPNNTNVGHISDLCKDIAIKKYTD